MAGRPAQYPRDRILTAARSLAQERGVAGVTMTAVAEALGAPSGSVYHRFRTRDELVAAMWLETVERFQAEVIPRLDMEGDPVDVAAAVSGWVVAWSRDHPDAAALLASHRGEDLPGAHTGDPAVRARRLRRELEAAFRQLAHRLGVETEVVRLAVAGIPLAALRPYLEDRRPPPHWVAAAVEAACRAVLTTAGAER